MATDVAARLKERGRLDVAQLVRVHAGPGATLVATAWWLIYVTSHWAGRDAPSVTVGAALVAVAVLLVRPYRVLPPLAVYTATAVSVAAFVVPLTAPSGWAGAPDGAMYACGAWLAVTVAAVVVTWSSARLWLLLLVAASAAIQFKSGWTAWWGGKDPTQPMWGTFYWYNPYAIFLVPGGLVGLALWIWRKRLIAVLGVFAFAFASMGVVYSTSRASLAVFVLGFALIGITALVGSERRRAARQLVLAAVIAAAAAYFVGGPPFFPHRASPLAGEQARSTGQSLGQNGGYRLDFWHEALTAFRRHPLTGGGYKSLVHESIGHVPKGWPLSPYAHNGYLQPLAEGGLILGVPFLLAVCAIALLCLRTLFRGLVRRQVGGETVAVAIALGMVMLHSGVDFDWTYAADFGMFAILSGLVVGLTLRDRDRPDSTGYGRVARYALVGCLLVGVGTLGLSAWVQRDGNHTVNLPRPTAQP